MGDESQDEKRYTLQLNEVIGHLKNRDYGLALCKAEILWQRMIKDSDLLDRYNL